MANRALVVMYHAIDENPVKDVAKNWRIPNKKVKHPFAWAAQIAILTLHREFYSNFMHMYEVSLTEENAKEFIMNLRMQATRGEVVAIWFSEDLEENVNAWHEASRALAELSEAADTASQMQKHLLGIKAPCNMKYENAKIDLEKYLDTVNADLAQLKDMIKRELQACSF
jgi:hypothetical protein